jgi:hypothetical protein
MKVKNQKQVDEKGSHLKPEIPFASDHHENPTESIQETLMKKWFSHTEKLSANIKQVFRDSPVYPLSLKRLIEKP